MNESSVFVDESGGFGEYDYHAPYYIIFLMFHNQNNDIQSDLSHFNDELAYINLSNHCVHFVQLFVQKKNIKECHYTN